MATKTFAQQTSDAQVMLSGLRANTDRLSKRSINEDFVAGLQADLDACIALNNEQKTLKAKLKKKTSDLNKKMEAMEKKVAEARKVVKLDISQTEWKEFGIADKR